MPESRTSRCRGGSFQGTVVRRVAPRGVVITPSESILFVESRQLACRHSSMLHLLVIRVVGKSEIGIKSGILPFKLDEWPVSYSKTGESCCNLRAFWKARNASRSFAGILTRRFLLEDFSPVAGLTSSVVLVGNLPPHFSKYFLKVSLSALDNLPQPLG